MLLDYFGLWYRAYTSGSAGSAKGGKKKPVYLERDGKILLFENNYHVAAFLKAEQEAKVTGTKVNPVKKRGKPLPEPKVIELEKIEPLAIKYDLVLQYKEIVCECDWTGMLELMQKLLRMRDEDDIEVLLMVA